MFAVERWSEKLAQRELGSSGDPLGRCDCQKLLREKSQCRRDLKQESIWGWEMEKKKVAVIGISGSGKTMFLTSLLWQLKEFKVAKFELGEIEIDGFRNKSSGGRDEDIFPLLDYQNEVANKSQWPRRTIGINRFRCQFKYSKRKENNKTVLSKIRARMQEVFTRRKSQQLDILDFPGARMMDAAIARYSNYDDWSDYILNYFSENNDYSKIESQLEQSLEEKDLDTGDKAIREYRNTLETFIKDGELLISPSIFLLNGKGSKFTLEAAPEHFCGLDVDSQFAPLPMSVRKNNHKITKRMRKYYKKYRRWVIRELFDDLVKSDSLIVLIGAPLLLLGGNQKNKDNKRIIFDLFHFIKEKKPQTSLFFFEAGRIRGDDGRSDITERFGTFEISFGADDHGGGQVAA